MSEKEKISRKKSVILGVTGSIAAVKAPAIARELARAGASVTCAMTESAEEFVTREDMQAATENDVIMSVFPRQDQPPPNPRLGKAGELLERERFSELTWHVHLARSADAMLIAPCSASTIGMLRAGIYDNAVTLVAASLPKGTPLVIVPAMDEDMWLQPAVQENLDWLKEHGVVVIEPVTGKLASGLTGMGRMPEPEAVVRQFQAAMARFPHRPPPNPLLEKEGKQSSKNFEMKGELDGKKVLITGGPTYEPIDAVRFIGNRSSGKMAVALALEAKRMGAAVTLILGPTTPFPLLDKSGIVTIHIERAEEMLQAATAEAPNADIVIMSAAVADFAPEKIAEGKLKKGSDDAMTLTLKKNPDILAEIAQSKKQNQFIVGFALEKGDDAEVYAKKKLHEKHLDMIVLNNIAEEGVGFGYDTNKITIFTESESMALPLLSKNECARIILDKIATHS